MGKMARGEIIVVMQDDDIPPTTDAWIRQSLSLMSKNSALALLGGYSGLIQGTDQCGKFGLDKDGKYGGFERLRMPYRDSTGLPFIFVALLNIGPFVMRRSIFLELGLFNSNFSCRGQEGIGFDYEWGVRVWKYGYQSGLIYPGFKYHAVKAVKTKESQKRYKARHQQEGRNTILLKMLHLGFYKRQGNPLRGRAEECRKHIKQFELVPVSEGTT